MRTFTNFDLTVKAFDTPVWAQERNLLQVHIANDYTTKIKVECSPYLAEYVPDNNGNVTVDVSDLVRSVASGVITVRTEPDDDIVEIDFANNGGLINPVKMIIPTHQYAGIVNEMTDDEVNNPILFPSVILKTPFTQYPTINTGEIFLPVDDPVNAILKVATVTFRGSSQGLITYENITNKALNQVLTVSAYRSGALLYITRHLELWNTDTPSSKIAEYPIVETTLQDCRQYACVQWVSRSGVIKRATWEVQKVTDNLDGSYEILRDDNAYDVRKGQQTTLQLVLENLNAYDFWYYSDIVTSSDVRVMLFEDEYDTTNKTVIEACKVEVTDKKVQQLDGNGGKFSTLKVNVNYKRYDTI